MRFQVLDSWRGIAALMVVFLHMNIDWTFRNAGIITHSWIFVDFFFVLSGFIISYSYEDRLKTRKKVVQFIIKRFGRLWPLHAFVLLCLIVLQSVILGLVHFAHFPMPNHRPFEGSWSASLILPHALLIHALGFWPGLGTWNGPSWSISVEFFAYMVFAFQAFLFGKRSILVSVTICSLSLFMLFELSDTYLEVTTNFGLLRCLYGFFLGVIVYRIFKHYSYISYYLATFCEIAVIAVVFLFIDQNGANIFSFCAPPLFAVVVYVFACERGGISVLFKNRLFLWLGDHSYTMYMVHFGIIVVLNSVYRVVTHRPEAPQQYKSSYTGLRVVDLGSPAANNIGVLAGLAIIFSIAHFAYKYVEIPARDWFKSAATGIPRPEEAKSAHANA